MKHLFATTLFFGMAMSLGLQVEIYDTAGCDLDAEMIGLVWYPAAYGIDYFDTVPCTEIEGTGQYYQSVIYFGKDNYPITDRPTEWTYVWKLLNFSDIHPCNLIDDDFAILLGSAQPNKCINYRSVYNKTSGAPISFQFSTCDVNGTASLIETNGHGCDGTALSISTTCNMNEEDETARKLFCPIPVPVAPPIAAPVADQPSAPVTRTPTGINSPTTTPSKTSVASILTHPALLFACALIGTVMWL
jgi:hypothetical protein